MCMRAVNQSVGAFSFAPRYCPTFPVVLIGSLAAGRAIRHRNDWAALVFVDSRYGTPRVRAKLPGWIGKQLEVPDAYGKAAGHLARFYAARKKVAALA